MGELGFILGILLAWPLSRPVAPLMTGFVVAVVIAILAVTASGTVPAEFYAVCAQVNPVFLVALVVEQRIAGRLSKTENQEAIAAEKAWTALQATRDLDIDEMKAQIEKWHDEWLDYWWVGILEDGTKINEAARTRYRKALGIQSVTVVTAVATLLAGQVTSLVGVLNAGTETDGVLFPLTASMLAASFTVIVVSALGELLPNATGMRGMLTSR
jgi:hypothetical protein